MAEGHEIKCRVGEITYELTLGKPFFDDFQRWNVGICRNLPPGACFPSEIGCFVTDDDEKTPLNDTTCRSLASRFPIEAVLLSPENVFDELLERIASLRPHSIEGNEDDPVDAETTISTYRVDVMRAIDDEFDPELELEEERRTRWPPSTQVASSTKAY